MARVNKYIRTIDKGDHAIVIMQLEDGTEVEIYCGGEVIVYFDERHNRVKAFVKLRRTQP